MAIISHGRQSLRTDALLPCTVFWHGNGITGTAKNISSDGIAVTLPAIILPRMQGPARISLQEPILLSVVPIHTEPDSDSFVIGFRVTKVEAGEQLWNQWNTVSHLSSPPCADAATSAPFSCLPLPSAQTPSLRPSTSHGRLALPGQEKRTGYFSADA